MGSGALMLWLDVEPGLEREADGWYIDEHMPERVDVGGYLRARRYAAIAGAPRYLTLFEAETPEALASEGYLGLVGRISEQSQRIRAGFSNVVRNTFAVRESRGRGIGAVVASLRLAPYDTESAEAAATAVDRLVPQWLKRHGIVGVHWLQAAPAVRARMDAVRAVGQSDAGADWVLLIEATRLADIEAVRGDGLSRAVLERSGFREEALAIYGLLYEVSAPETMPAGRS